MENLNRQFSNGLSFEITTEYGTLPQKKKEMSAFLVNKWKILIKNRIGEAKLHSLELDSNLQRGEGSMVLLSLFHTSSVHTTSYQLHIQIYRNRYTGTIIRYELQFLYTYFIRVGLATTKLYTALSGRWMAKCVRNFDSSKLVLPYWQKSNFRNWFVLRSCRQKAVDLRVFIEVIYFA